MKKYILIMIAVIGIISLATYISKKPAVGVFQEKIWQFQAIDTMKYSRDVSREKLTDPTFDVIIHKQIEDIANAGATHVGIATPYDEEFLPILKRWVQEARKNNLKVWFRGNWSGWEKWFEYPAITRSEHIKKTEAFILNNAELFEDGDVFSACPECENGGPGDPRLNNDAQGHKEFLVSEYAVTKNAFKQINKKVASNYHSMNGDVAKLIMDKKTTAALDGLVVIDHYVKTPEKLAQDIREIAKNSGGKVILGEFGAPIPDIHGTMTQEQQAEWITKTFEHLIQTPELIGMSYWVNVGGSTQLWEDDNKRLGVDALAAYYNPFVLTGRIINDIAEPVTNAKVTTERGVIYTDDTGSVRFPSLNREQIITIEKEGYPSQTVKVSTKSFKVTLNKKEKGFLYHLKEGIRITFPL